MFAAVRSAKAAQKRQHDIPLAAKIGQANFIIVRVGESKIGCEFHTLFTDLQFYIILNLHFPRLEQL